MTTLADVRTRVAERLQDPNFGSITSASVDLIINTAIRYYKYRPYWFNESLYTQTLAINIPTISLPADFLCELQPGGLTIAYSNMYYPLTKVPTQIYDNQNVTGVGMPYCYTYRHQGIELYWYPDQAYTLNLRYLKDYATLVNNNDTNDFLTYADMMITYNALSRIYAEYEQDSNMESYYTARAQDEEIDLKKRSDSSLGTGRLTVYSNLIR